MPKVYMTTLRPASGGFGEWDWVEAGEVEGCEDYFDYEQMLSNETPTVDFEQTDVLNGCIHRQQGRVYRFKHPLTESDRALGLDDGDLDTYEMVWVEDDDA